VTEAPTYRIGQTVWVLDTQRHKTHVSTAIITKLGRKWATLSDHKGRFDVATGELDGGVYSSPGRIYLSQEAYEAKVALSKAWGELRQILYRHPNPPPGLTLETILDLSQRLK
jgi:hypothetical protein